MEKKALTQVTINEVIASRWSPRAFDPQYILEDKQITSLMEAARWAPSCRGEQPWKFVLFNKSDATAFSQALNCLSVSNQDWAMDASLLILSCANPHYRHNGQENGYAHYDTGAASENICLQATSLNLAAHQMGGFSKDKAREVAHVPDNYDILSFIAIGKPLEMDQLREDQKERELNERSRLPLEQIFSFNQFKE
jgi:nitroreductase